MDRLDIERDLNESRNWLLSAFRSLSPEQLHEPLTKSEHDDDNSWSALDHFAHLALIERDFAKMIRRHVHGDDRVVAMLYSETGERRGREEILAAVHKFTEDFQIAHHNDTFESVVAMTGAARADTLALLCELTDDQLREVLPGAPWADGTIGGVLWANSGHARMHWNWLCDAGLASSTR